MFKFSCHLFSVILFVALVNVTIGVDYCAICDDHIACNPPSGFGDGCEGTGAIITLTQADQNQIIDLHNSLRNKAATGNLNGFESASRMATVKWNSELASLATILVKTCEMEHDSCHNTQQFKWAGQNLAWSAASNKFQNKTVVLNAMINDWFNEYKVADMDVIDSYPANDDGPEYGHFTQVVRDKSTDVGCALINYKADGWYSTLLACNYALTNIIGEPVYTTGTACSGCTTGCNPKYPGLCKIGENISPVA